LRIRRQSAENFGGIRPEISLKFREALSHLPFAVLRIRFTALNFSPGWAMDFYYSIDY
jgi:hypothetical protein